MAGIERRFAHQAVDAGLGPQPTVGVRPFELDGRTLDPSDLAFGQLDDLGLETVSLAPHEVHAQQHVRPVLGLGPPGPSLDVHVGVARIHLAREHLLELELIEPSLKCGDVFADRRGERLVCLFARQFGELAGLPQFFAELGKAPDLFLKARALTPQFLGALAVFPDLGLLQLALDLAQAPLFGAVVKDAPAARRNAPRAFSAGRAGGRSPLAVG
jgi:hypothetical protein